MTDKIRIKQFTLLEVLVASCIIGIFMSVLLGGFSATMKDSEIAADYIKAVRLAQLKFNDIMLTQELKEAEDSGVSGESGKELKWRTSIKKSGKEKEFTVQVEVTFGDGKAARSFSMKSFIMRSEKSGNKKKEDDGKTANADTQA